jgi:hypothetical protein
VLAAHTTAYQFGSYRLNPMARTLVRDDKVVPLPPKAIEVLAELVKQPGEVVGKQQLLHVVWPETFVEEDTLSALLGTGQSQLLIARCSKLFENDSVRELCCRCPPSKLRQFNEVI